MTDPPAEAEPARTAAEDEEALFRTVRRLVTREPSLAVMLVEVAHALTDALAVDGCLVFRVDANADLVVAASYPIAPDEGDRLRLAAGFGVTGRVAADCVPVVLVDDFPRNVQHRQLLGLNDNERVSRLCVPARLPSGGCTAVLAVHSRTRRAFPDSELVLVQRVADLIGLRIHIARLTAAMDEHRQAWTGLVAATVNAQEAERRRMAGDLHDGVTQAIAGLDFHLSAAQMALTVDGDLTYAAEQVRAARGLADLAFQETRSAITGLHSPVLDDLGLAAALASMSRAVPNLQIEVEAQDVDLPEHVVNSLFRVAQEAIQNVAKHAAASKAVVRLTKHGHSVVLTVVDDGCGFAPQLPSEATPGERVPRSRYGLAGMSERVHLIGGQLDITSAEGEGTTVKVTVPDVL